MFTHIKRRIIPRDRKILSMQDAFKDLAENIVRVANFPDINSYKPHAKQELFHRSAKRTRLYIGGTDPEKLLGGSLRGFGGSLANIRFRLSLIGLLLAESFRLTFSMALRRSSSLSSSSGYPRLNCEVGHGQAHTKLQRVRCIWRMVRSLS